MYRQIHILNVQLLPLKYFIKWDLNTSVFKLEENKLDKVYPKITEN